MKTSSVVPIGEGYYEETIVEYVDNGRRRKALALVLVLLLMLFAAGVYVVTRMAQPAGAPSGSTSNGMSWIRSLYAWGNSPRQMLQSPASTDIGPDGTVWTVSGKQYIVGFAPNGQVRRVIAPPIGMAPGQVTSLEGIAIGDDGSIYVSDFGSNRIDVFSASGRFLRSWEVQLPVVLDVKGNTVAVAAANGIGVFDTQGRLISKWGSRGSGEDQVDLPHGIAIGSDGSIYIADTQNSRVKAYDQRGRLLWVQGHKAKVGSNLMSTEGTSPTTGGVDQGMDLPTGLAQDSKGRLILTDAFEFQVLVLDPARKGQIVARYGDAGQKDGQFGYPTGVAYDRNRDTLSVADTANNRIQLIRIPGTGGSVVARAWTSLTDTPVWLCVFPLLLLVAAALLFHANRRGERRTGAAGTDRVASA